MTSKDNSIKTFNLQVRGDTFGLDVIDKIMEKKVRVGNHDEIITNTSREDLDVVLWLFEEAMSLQGKNGYRVWDNIDKKSLIKDIEIGRQYKIQKDEDILCIFCIQHNDPFIWRSRDLGDAIYLHRIVTHPNFKGQQQFKKVLTWAVQFARANCLRYVRMDTWADNLKIIAYYESFGFNKVETYVTPDTPDLPTQNRNIAIVLLELSLTYDF